jgi:hypothetical protein
MRIGIRFALAAFAAAMFLGTAQDARAVYSPYLVSVVDNLDGTYTWNYDVNWASGGNYQLVANGGINPGVIGSTDFFTLYDVNGYIDGTAVAGASHELDSVNYTGINGPLTAVPDNPNIVNLTFRFTGPALGDDATYAGFSFQSTISSTTLGYYSSQYTNGPTTPSANTKIGEAGQVDVPGAVPEPSSMALVGMGLAGLFGYGYRRRRQG